MFYSFKTFLQQDGPAIQVSTQPKCQSVLRMQTFHNYVIRLVYMKRWLCRPHEDW